MSFTKIPNFSNCNIWLPQQQLNIVMKYYHTRVKSTSFLKFSSLFLVKCHLYNKHFHFFLNSPTTQANFFFFLNYAHYCDCRHLLFLTPRKKARKIRWPPIGGPLFYLLFFFFLKAQPRARQTLLIGSPNRLDLEMTGLVQHVAQLNKLHSFQNRIVNFFFFLD